ncbi:MAG: hypothetical protein ACRDZR_06930 [Acidimicrobiales bacterium]
MSIAEVAGSVFVAVDYSQGTRDCWGVADLKANFPIGTTTAVDGLTATGTWFFVDANVASSTCKASAFDTATKVGSTPLTSFPSA